MPCYWKTIGSYELCLPDPKTDVVSASIVISKNARMYLAKKELNLKPGTVTDLLDNGRVKVLRA